MTHKERFLRTMHFQSVDHVPDQEFGYWGETLVAWHSQGLPEWVNSNEAADQYFGFAPQAYAPVNNYIIPAFEWRILEEDDQHRIIIDSGGVKCLVHKDGKASIPKHLKFPIESREDWEEFKIRLDPTTPGRYPDNWDAIRDELNACDAPVGISGGSLFGWVRNHMGFENLSMMCADDPEFVEEMVEYTADMIVTVIEKAVREVKFDMCMIWEDIAFNKDEMRALAQQFRPEYSRATFVDGVRVEDGGTFEKTQSLLASGAKTEIIVGDEELLIRHHHQVTDTL